MVGVSHCTHSLPGAVFATGGFFGHLFFLCLGHTGADVSIMQHTMCPSSRVRQNFWESVDEGLRGVCRRMGLGGSWHPGRTPDAVPQASRATRDLCGSRSTSVCTAAPARFCGEPMSMVYRGPIPFPFVSTPIARENPSSTRESSGVHIQLKDRLTLAWRGGHAVW